MSVLYNRITEYRISKGITASAVEKGSDLSNGALTKWNHSIPSGDKILRVANYLDVSVDYLLGNTDNPQSHKNPETLRATLTSLAETLKREAETIEEVLNAPVASNNSDE